MTAASEQELPRLRRDQCHIHVRRRHNARLILICNGKTMRKIKHVAFIQAFNDLWPLRTLASIRKQILDHRPPFSSFVNRK